MKKNETRRTLYEEEVSQQTGKKREKEKIGWSDVTFCHCVSKGKGRQTKTKKTGWKEVFLNAAGSIGGKKATQNSHFD